MATAFYSHPDCLLHEMGAWHPECPARLQAIEDQLIAGRIDALIERESPPLADEAALLRVHTQAHVDYLRSRSPDVGYAEIDPDTSMNPHTWQAALRAAGAAVAATDAVIEGTLRQRILQRAAAGTSRGTGARDGLLLLQQRRDRSASRA
jgi:acetoin utilization deacetylase AcuC-like enzyme